MHSARSVPTLGAVLICTTAGGPSTDITIVFLVSSDHACPSSASGAAPRRFPWSVAAIPRGPILASSGVVPAVPWPTVPYPLNLCCDIVGAPTWSVTYLFTGFPFSSGSKTLFIPFLPNLLASIKDHCSSRYICCSYLYPSLHPVQLVVAARLLGQLIVADKLEAKPASMD